MVGVSLAIRQSIRDEIILNIRGAFADADDEAGADPFIAQYNGLIDQATDEMIRVYTEDGDIDELEIREGDWVREFMDEIFDLLPQN
jgi:hypothetical protein